MCHLTSLVNNKLQTLEHTLHKSVAYHILTKHNRDKWTGSKPRTLELGGKYATSTPLCHPRN